jgi:hypothetical protein
LHASIHPFIHPFIHPCTLLFAVAPTALDFRPPMRSCTGFVVMAEQATMQKKALMPLIAPGQFWMA